MQPFRPTPTVVLLLLGLLACDSASPLRGPTAGGTPGGGGIGGAGGRISTGGFFPTGGTPTTGGIVPSGGLPWSTGGLPSSTGGLPSSGGFPNPFGGSTPVADNTVTFLHGQAQGAMTGWGWVNLGMRSTLTSPQCDSGVPITSATPCTTATVWSRSESLCMTGTIPALPAAPVQNDFDQNWGMMIGVNAKEPNDALGKTYQSIQVSVTRQDGPPVEWFRLQLHLQGDPDDKWYCTDYQSVPLEFTRFSTRCWDNSGDRLQPSMSPMITKVAILIPSTSVARPVTDYCLHSITFH